MTPTFEELVATLRNIQFNCSPAHESEIENCIERYLKSKHYPVRRQVVVDQGRFDMIVGKIVIEAKLVGRNNILDQLDRYSSACDGMIILCWKATKPFRQVFALAKPRVKIPVELIELNKNCEVV